MKIFANLPDVPAALLDMGKGPETSVSLTPLGHALSPGDVVAVRQGGRLCDVVVAACLEGDLPPGQVDILAEAGVHVLLMPGRHLPGALCRSALADGTDVTFFSQVLFAVMPSAVCIAQDNLLHQRMAKALENTYPGIFETVIPETPQALLDERQQQLNGVLVFAQAMLDQGERVVRTLLQQVLAALHAQGFDDIRHLALFDAETLDELTAQTTRDMFLFAEVVTPGGSLRQSVALKVYGF